MHEFLNVSSYICGNLIKPGCDILLWIHFSICTQLNQPRPSKFCTRVWFSLMIGSIDFYPLQRTVHPRNISIILKSFLSILSYRTVCSHDLCICLDSWSLILKSLFCFCYSCWWFMYSNGFICIAQPFKCYINHLSVDFDDYFFSHLLKCH